MLKRIFHVGNAIFLTCMFVAITPSTATARNENQSNVTSIAASGQDQAADKAVLDKLYEDAKKEGKVIWYTSQIPTLDEAVIAAFKESYPGIDVEYLRLTSGPIATRYASERKAGVAPADVLTTGNPEFFEKTFKDGWFLEDAGLPAMKSWPAGYYSNGLARTSVQPLFIAYNTSLVKPEDAPKTWKDLLDPKWKDKILLGDPRNVPTYVALFEILRTEYGNQFLVELGQQNPVLVNSIVPGSQQVAAGVAPILVPLTHVLTEPLVKKGAPIALSTVTPTTGLEYFSAISAEAPHPAAAKLFYNFMHTVAGQIAISGEGGMSPLGNISDSTHAIPDTYITPPFDEGNAHKNEILSLLNIK